MTSTRKVTNELIELAEEGVITWESIALAIGVYLTEGN